MRVTRHWMDGGQCTWYILGQKKKSQSNLLRREKKSYFLDILYLINYNWYLEEKRRDTPSEIYLKPIWIQIYHISQDSPDYSQFVIVFRASGVRRASVPLRIIYFESLRIIVNLQIISGSLLGQTHSLRRHLKNKWNFHSARRFTSLLKYVCDVKPSLVSSEHY